MVRASSRWPIYIQEISTPTQALHAANRRNGQRHSSGGLHNLEPLGNKLCNLLILVLQQAQGKGDIVPLTLRLAARKPGCELLR